MKKPKPHETFFPDEIDGIRLLIIQAYQDVESLSEMQLKLYLVQSLETNLRCTNFSQISWNFSLTSQRLNSPVG